MKRIFILFCLLLVLFSCQKKVEIDLKTETKKVENVLDRYAIALENKDLVIIESIWKNANDILMYGTDSDEKLVGWENIRKAYVQQFEEFDNTFISISDQIIRFDKQARVAWFSQIMKYNFIQDSIAHSFDGLRFTGVLEKNEGDDWKLVQGHLSIPVSDPRQKR